MPSKTYWNYTEMYNLAPHNCQLLPLQNMAATENLTDQPTVSKISVTA